MQREHWRLTGLLSIKWDHSTNVKGSRSCPLLALSGHFNRALERSLLGEERTIASAR